jgi:peptidyl-prolyl cis-trans isomerase C
MNIRITSALLAGLVVLLAACDRGDPVVETPVTDDAETLALVNGVPITRTDLFTYVGLEGTPDIAGTEGLLDELINLELLRQQAVAAGIDREEETRIILRNVETNLLASQVIERRTQAMRFSDAEIQAEYDAQIAVHGSTEYRARHILVRQSGLAAELIAQLDAGADLAELAEAHSIDGSAAEGGDLGWFAAGQMVPAFSEAVAALEPGAYSPEPVATQFGWHVIQLTDTRAIEAPPLADVQPLIEEILQTRALRAYMEELRANARIEFPIRPGQ